jgi:hypothetical protein
LYYDGTDYWLADGYHRVYAVNALAVQGIFPAQIDAEIRQGTQRDAIFASCAANKAHGIPRTDGDKRRAIDRMLADEEWRTWSDQRIAEHCSVSAWWVGECRKRMYPPSANPGSEMRTVQRGAATYQMDTARIGRQAASGHDPLAGGAGDDRHASQYNPSPPRPAGYRERDMRNPALQIEGTLLSIRNAMSALPSAAVAAAAVPHFGLEEADRFAMWWTDFAEELRDRAERAA